MHHVLAAWRAALSQGRSSMLLRRWLSRIAVRRYLERTLGAVLVALGVQLAVESP